MNADRNNKNFDELISHTIGRDKPQFDFDKWQINYKEEIETFKSQTTEQKKNPVRIYKIGKIIMKNPVRKFAAAAVIIIVLSLMLNNGSVDIITPAFGLDDITAAMQKAEWVHCTMTLEELSGDTDASPIGIGEGWESWESINPSLSIEKHSNGKIFFTETDTAKTFRYDPETNIITVVYEIPSASRETYTSISDMFNKTLNDLKKQFDKVKYEKGVFEGRPVTTISVDVDYTSEGGLHSIISFIVDSETYLPIKMSVQQTSLKKNLTGKMTGIFGYPNTGPKDIYEAGAPRDAKVVRIEAADNRDNPELVEVLEPYNKARENLVSDYILITTYQYGSWVRTIDVIYNQGRKQRSEYRPVWRSVNSEKDKIAYKKALGDSFESLLKWSQDYLNTEGRNLGIYIYDGEYYYRTEKDPLDEWTIHEKAHRPDHNPIGLNDLSECGWPKILPKNNVKQVENEYSKENGLIAFERISEPDIRDGKLARAAQKDIYYLDPSHDYMCVRKEDFLHRTGDNNEVKDVEFEPNEIQDELSSVRFVSEFGQTDKGQWYPEKIETHSKSRDADGKEKPLSLSFIYTLYLKTNPVFPEGIFDPNNLPKEGD